MRYQILYNDSPAKIARKFGLSMRALIGANPRKLTTIVAGVPTWSEVRVGETINVPLGGIVGAAVPTESKKAAIESLMFVGGPCIETNVAVVCGVQAILGVGYDGKWGNDTSTEARKYVPNAPAGCSPRPAWWAPRGVSNCTGDMPIPRYDLPPEERPAVKPGVPPLSQIQALLTFDPCLEENVFAVCAAQNVLVGVTVDGKYGSGTATAARAIVPGAPAGCSPRPAWWAPPGQSNCVAAPPVEPPVAPPPTPPPLTDVCAPGTVFDVATGECVLAPPVAPPPTPPPVAPPPAISVPAAVQALLTLSPCLEANALAVCAAQRVLGVTADGKYGSGTATAARSLLPNAPAGCSPRPAWWAPPGQSNCVTRAPVLPPAPPAPPPEPPPNGEIITPPEEKKGLSTGSIIAGGLGAAALVGLTAVAITQKKKPTTKRRRPTKRKTTKRKKTRKKKRK